MSNQTTNAIQHEGHLKVDGAIQLSDVQRERLRKRPQQTDAVDLVRRLLAILALNRGETRTSAAEMVAACRSSVGRWEEAFLAGELDGLGTDKPGPDRMTTDEAM